MTATTPDAISVADALLARIRERYEARERDEIDAVATDHRRATHRDHIRRAINLVARENDGLVHIADVRPLLPTWIAPCQIGSYFCMQRRAERLIPTGEYRPNGGHKSRNRTKPAQVYRLAAPIPEEES